MKDPLGVSPSKGNQGTTRGKEKKSFDLGGNRTHDLRIRSTVTLPRWRSKEFFLYLVWFPRIPFTRANAQWVFPGFHIAL